MFKRNKFYTVVAASALISISAMSTAQQSETSTASVIVSNSFTLTEVAPLSFGTLGVFQSKQVDPGVAADVLTDAQAPIYTVKSDGSANVTENKTPTNANTMSRLVEVVPGTPAEFSISNAVRFTNLEVEQADTDIELADPTIDDALDSTFLVNIALGHMTIVGGPNDGLAITNLDVGAPAGTARLRTDTDGNVGFKVGAEVRPNFEAAAILDGNYVGTFNITVKY